MVFSLFLVRLKSVWLWLREARHVWLSLSVIGLALAISLGPWASEPVIRLTGLALQLMGIGTVAWGISETRALFGYPSLASKAKAWVGRFPLLRRAHVFTAKGVGTVGFAGKARAHVTHGPTSPTLEGRVEALEKNIAAVHRRISETQEEMDEGFQKSVEGLKREGELREKEDNAVRGRLEATGTGGIHISAIGASWLFVGVILSAASIEIDKFLK